MASASANKKNMQAAVNLPECPVCLDTMSAPILQCASGHSICGKCTRNLYPPICPICRQPILMQMRNWQLEDILNKAKIACPNKSAGCVIMIGAMDVENHLKECIFRQMECPLGTGLGLCSWNGYLKEMLNHFQERHPTSIVSSDIEVNLEKVELNKDDRHIFLVVLGKIHFLLTVKIDTLHKLSYWAVQMIGGKTMAYQHIYEIHITSNQDNRRKAVFIEHCFNDSIKADEVFRQNKCAMMPLDFLKNFISNKKLSFRFFIKRLPSNNNDKKIKGDQNKTTPKPGEEPLKTKKKGPKGPAPKNNTKAA